MKYISIDCEMTGTDHNYCQIIEFGAIIEDTEKPLSFEELPKYHRYVEHETICGQIGAIAMHNEIWQHFKRCEKMDDELKYNEKIISVDNLMEDFNDWLQMNGYKKNLKGIVNIHVAGKNFGTFDLRFIEMLPNYEKHIRIAQRILDPAILYFDSKDDKLPNLEECKVRAGLPKEVAHTAIADAWDVIKLLRLKLNK